VVELWGLEGLSLLDRVKERLPAMSYVVSREFVEGVRKKPPPGAIFAPFCGGFEKAFSALLEDGPNGSGTELEDGGVELVGWSEASEPRRQRGVVGRGGVVLEAKPLPPNLELQI